jgi:protein-tyrosine phosphatase
MMSEDGRRVKSGMLIRCGHLVELTPEDEKKLSDLADVVVDFRTDNEREERSNITVPGISYVHIPIVDSLTPGISREEESDKKLVEKMLLNPDAAREYMCGMFRSFAEGSALSQFEAFIRVLLEDHDKAVIWHCTAGKDRAGIASALVEKLLGIAEEDIIADYLATNTYLEGDIVFLTNLIKKRAKTDSPLADRSLRYLFGAHREFIEAYYSEITDRYGDFETLSHNGLGLSDDDIGRLRDKYLEDPTVDRPGR